MEQGRKCHWDKASVLSKPVLLYLMQVHSKLLFQVTQIKSHKLIQDQKKETLVPCPSSCPLKSKALLQTETGSLYLSPPMLTTVKTSRSRKPAACLNSPSTQESNLQFKSGGCKPRAKSAFNWQPEVSENSPVLKSSSWRQKCSIPKLPLLAACN